MNLQLWDYEPQRVIFTPLQTMIPTLYYVVFMVLIYRELFSSKRFKLYIFKIINKKIDFYRIWTYNLLLRK